MATSASSDQHIDAARRRLSHLAGVGARVRSSEAAIAAGATHRLQVVLEELGQLRPRVNLDDTAGDRFQALTLERGQLEQVLATSRQHGAVP